ncbi:hypothetical protein ABIB86_000453 [Bradyrhizobium sp. JR1.7]|uniref:hypothetical protein n=1 Tax=unclassified Bradyrhizobium TaxID=2631580 RepID=UPI003395B6ED
MIEPSNGRIVWYTPYKNELLSPYGMVTQRGADGKPIPLTAQICAVWGPRMVNLLVTDATGKTFAVTSRALLQDDDLAPDGGGYAQWMPYQKGQAAKAEAKASD